MIPREEKIRVFGNIEKYEEAQKQFHTLSQEERDKYIDLSNRIKKFFEDHMVYIIALLKKNQDLNDMMKLSTLSEKFFKEFEDQKFTIGAFIQYLKIYVNSLTGSMDKVNRQYNYAEKHPYKPKKYKKKPKKKVENICGGTIGDLLKAKGQI